MSTSTPAPHIPFVPPKTSIFLHLVMGLLILAMGAIGTGFAREAWQGWSLSHDVAGFQPVQGHISKVSTRNEGQDHVPDVRYVYTIEGQRHQGSNHATARSYRDAMLASRDANQHTINQPITVFVDPHDADRSTLSREVPTERAMVRTVYAALFYGIAAFVAITHFRARKKAKILAYSRHLERQRQAELDDRRAKRQVIHT